MRVYLEQSGVWYSLPAQPRARGGEGEVYSASSSLLVKVYHDKFRTPERETHVRFIMQRLVGVQGFAPPSDIALDGPSGKFLGFAMPPAPGQQLHNYYGSDLDTAAKIAESLTELFVETHKRSIRIPDGNYCNFLVHKSFFHLTVTGIDTDSYAASYRGPNALKTTFDVKAGLDDLLAPETARGEFTEHSDVFTLAIHIYQLFTGKHPFIYRTPPGIGPLNAADCIREGTYQHSPGISLPPGSVPSASIDHLPQELQELFERTFGPEGHAHPERRPAAQEYLDVLRGWKPLPSPAFPAALLRGLLDLRALASLRAWRSAIARLFVGGERIDGDDSLTRTVSVAAVFVGIVFLLCAVWALIHVNPFEVQTRRGQLWEQRQPGPSRSGSPQRQQQSSATVPQPSE